MIKVKKCPICNGVRFTHKMLCKDHTTSKKNFNVVSCETCGFTLTNPRPNSKDLPLYYISDKYISHTNNSQGIFNWLYQKVRIIAVGKKIKLLKSFKSRGCHLDIGCGTGEFLNACKKTGLKTKGIEPSEIARKKAIKNYKLDISDDTDLSKYKNHEFGSISMWHVLEHIEDLKETVQELDRILKKDGKLFIAVPNHKCWDAKYYKEYWAAWDVPIHLWHFSKSSIQNLFENSNLKLIKTKPMIFDSFYVSLMSEEFKFGKKNYIKGFFIGIISNLHGFFTKKGYSSTIYIFEKGI